ncbi:hypothetical protein CUJ83_10865 [Methanocella sp. CWC-04]|uniref:DUF790 family protein n=1 Tax=Methanooceanicella nereidis TaxID=2052831 RepID=A0AAP2W5H2_9EURY|nr:DUF790 family protein [Methanocella sp. CWC-04]MCD1295500.1 hypothetical protein [Methanocella sp. CWC-04]
MLPSELLKTKVWRGEISPIFIEPSEEYLELAGDMIGIFKDSTGKKLGELKDILEEMEDQGFDYRLVRGLVALLERRCELVVESSLDPVEIRQTVFRVAARQFPVISDAQRSSAIKEAAGILEMTEKEVEASMYADLENELLLKQFTPLTPAELVYRYNLSIAQTLLFKAVDLRFTASGNHQDILRNVKRLGLMYDARYLDGRVEISLDGPVSALKMTERYGTSLARLLPFIVMAPGWEMEASIVRKDYSGEPRIYHFRMSEKGCRHLFGDLMYQEDISFDSEPEERFYESFVNAGTGWSIIREPEPLITGKRLYIPDFLLEKDGIKVYIEIAGFWTADYLRKKSEKLHEIKDKNLIVLVNSKMACDALKDIIGDVIFFDKKIPLKQILDRLKEFDDVLIRKGLEKIAGMELTLTGDVISVAVIAEREHIPSDSIRIYAESPGINGYVIAGDELVSKVLIKGLETSLKNTMPYHEAVKTINSKGISAADPVLKLLGYTVKWSGLDPESAVINKK